MQKVIRRTAMAERQAARRLAKRKDKAQREWAKSNREQVNFARKDEVAQIKKAKLVRREDYELGPLAPRRDVGDAKETYGTILGQRIRGQPLDYRKIEKVLEPFGGKYLNIVAGDRVVLIEGRDKGKIGKVSKIDAKNGELTVEGLNMVDVEVPKWMQTAEESDKRPIRSMEKPVPFSSVRLVFPLNDPATGTTRDVIVKKIVNGGIWHDRHLNQTRWQRYIAGLDIKIPWPKKEPKEYKDNPSDTLRLDVEVKSFVPTLLRPPMPGSVIDELRNKYSKFRTRHDLEYIEAKIKEDQEKELKKQSIKEMRTPLKEIHRRERKARKARGKGKLTEEMLERIGQVIAKKKQLMIGATEVLKEGAVAVA